MSDYLQPYDTSEYLVPTNGLDRLAASACHGALLFGMPFVLPLAVFFLYPLVSSSAYVRNQALQALLFHGFFLLVSTATGYVLLGTFLSGLASAFFHPLLIALPLALLICLVGGLLTLWCIVLMFVATLKALQGRPYSLPFVGSWVH